MNTQKIKDGLRLLDDVIAELHKFARTKTEAHYLTKPIARARARVVDTMVKVEFLQEARKQNINTSHLARVGKPKG